MLHFIHFSNIPWKSLLGLVTNRVYTVGENKKIFDIISTRKQTDTRLCLSELRASYWCQNFFTARYQKDFSGYQRDSPRVYRRKEWWICLQSCEYFARLFVGIVMWKISFWFSVCIAAYFEKRAVAWSASVRASADGIIWIWNSVNRHIFNSYPFLLRWNVIGPTSVSSISRCILFVILLYLE